MVANLDNCWNRVATCISCRSSVISTSGIVVAIWISGNRQRRVMSSRSKLLPLPAEGHAGCFGDDTIEKG